jgi:hypothetical protein
MRRYLRHLVQPLVPPRGVLSCGPRAITRGVGLILLLTACGDNGSGVADAPQAAGSDVMSGGSISRHDDSSGSTVQEGEARPSEPGSGQPDAQDPPANASVDTSAPGVTVPPNDNGLPATQLPGAGEEPFVNCDTPGPRLIRRLTAEQYQNTLAALVGDGFPVEEVFSDPAINGFHVDADAALVSDLTAELLMNYAERVAAWVLDNQVWRVATCNTHEESCHRQVISEFGRRAFRREPTDEQMNTYLSLFAAEESFEAGLYVVLSTMLQSPYLLYRRELGEPDPENPGQYRLTPYEVASELSYFLSNGPPDDQLLNAAAEGRLTTREELDQQVYGLLSRDGSQNAFAAFVHGWLEVDTLYKKAKDPAVLEFSQPLREAMLGETRSLFLELFQSGGTIADLFTADFTMLNQPLAELYGFGGVSGDGFTRVAVEGRRSTGILGHASFLTEHSLPDNSSPVQRGRVVRERLLCQDLPPVPENLDTNLSDAAGFSNNRERYEQHSADPACAGCHRLIDPVGFAFENYDAFGRYRESENGTPIDASGELSGVVGGPVPLSGLQSLSDFLSISDEARSCLIRYWSYFAYGREGWSEQQCNHDAIRAEAAANDYKLQSTLFAILHAPHFSRRVAD